MNNKIDKKNLEDTIETIVTTLENNFKYQRNKKIPIKEVYELTDTLFDLLKTYLNVEEYKCCDLIIKRVIPIINLMLVIYDLEGEKNLTYLKEYYRIAARRSLFHWLIYYEWDIDEDKKVFEKRVEILNSYIYYLNYITWNKKDLTLIVNLPSGWAKTYTYAQYCAFRIGTDQDGTFLSICSNDDLVKQMSRTIMNIIQTDQFGDVFPNLDYRKLGKSLFLKATDGEWKIKGNPKAASYIAKSRDSNTVGFRSYYSTFCDDMYKNPDESLDPNLNRRLFTDYQTVWTERTAKGYPKQFVLAGTIWSPYDLMTQVIELEKTRRTFIKHPKFKFTEVSDDGRVVIIKVPALDENGESNCPEIATTKELNDKKNAISTYLWECNYMQNPIPPEGLPFDYKNLKVYSQTPNNIYGYCKASIDANRKSGKDFFSMPILQPNDKDEWELVDCLFTQRATTELYDEIIEKISKHHIIELVIETNVQDGLSQELKDRLIKANCTFCNIVEKYNTLPKATRIEMAKGNATRKIVYPAKGMFGVNTDLGKFMEQHTTYSAVSRNVHEDASDSLSMFILEVVEEASKTPMVEILKGVRQYF